MKKKKIKDYLISYAFVLPAFLLLITFVILPTFYAFYLSLTEFNGFQAPSFIGIKNYFECFQDIAVRMSLLNTLKYVLVSMPAVVIISLVISELLASRFRNRFGEFVRGTLFIPVLCSATLVGSIFSNIFSADAGGFINTIFLTLGLNKVNWLGSEETALNVIIFISIWKNVGYYVVILYAGIMDIPNSLYEASAIDGANKFQQFLYVTIPNLRTVLVTVITICTIWSFQVFDMPYILTAGGPGYATTTLAYQLYIKGFKSLNFGYANAIGMILFVVVIIINILQRPLAREED